MLGLAPHPNRGRLPTVAALGAIHAGKKKDQNPLALGDVTPGPKLLLEIRLVPERLEINKLRSIIGAVRPDDRLKLRVNAQLGRNFDIAEWLKHGSLESSSKVRYTSTTVAEGYLDLEIPEVAGCAHVKDQYSIPRALWACRVGVTI